MSGQPNRKPQDVDNFRQDYMNQLNLRASIDDVNYQANKVYKATGALPPQSSMPDTRSTSEILADVERLKVELIAEFKPLLNAQSAALLIQRISQSPLNGDGSLLVFLSQNAKQIVPKLQMRYAKGVKGDEGDIETLKAFIENLYTELKDSTGSIKSFFDRPQNQSAELQMNSGDYRALIRQYDKIRLQLMTKRDPAINDLLDDVSAIFNLMDDCYDMNQQTINEYTKTLVLLQNPRPDQVRAAQELLEFVSDIPNPSQLRALITQLDKSIKNSNPELSRTILTNILSILPTSPAKNLTLQRVPYNIRRYVTDPEEFIDSMGGSQNDGSQSGVDFISDTSSTLTPPTRRAPPPPDDSSSDSSSISPPTRDAPPPPSDTSLKNGILSVLSNGITYGVRKALQEDIKTGGQLSDVELDAIYSEAVQKSFQHLDSKPEFNGWQDIVGFTPAKYTQVYNLYSRRLTEVDDPEATLEQITLYGKLTDDIKQQLISAGMSGSGIKKRGRVKGSGIATPKKFLVDKVDHTKGIKPDKKYIPFGKYYIHNHKLNDNILSFRQPSGVSVIGQPAHRVSDKLGGVIRSIVGGKVPSFNELNGLTEEEKNYLYKVAKKADIADKISIPTPSKDAMEKDIHDFEVMKGEIMAGNDSKELIKKFKLLLLKLSKNGSLPKVDVQEIMEELLTLGY